MKRKELTELQRDRLRRSIYDTIWNEGPWDRESLTPWIMADKVLMLFEKWSTK